MEGSIVMNGGEGPKSYFRNSKLQKIFLDGAMILLMNSIEESLDLKNRTKIFSIADLGCSTGPNTFFCVNHMIEAVQQKYDNTLCPDDEPEFHVFFNDQVGNDFNTLFKSLPSKRQYMAAGVPGSFYRRLFPRSSMNLIHSSISLHWLQRVPEGVMNKDSPYWNKGRITYAKSPTQVVNAFRDQFFRDLKDFLKARSEELVPGGLLAMIMLGRPEGTSPPEAIHIHTMECLGDAASDLVKEGVMGEDVVDSFNLPVFFPALSEVEQVLDSFKQYLTIERLQEIDAPIGRLDAQFLSAHFRAILQGTVCEHFGPKLTEQIFDKFPHKLESFMNTKDFARPGKATHQFALVKRKDVPS
ncbi:OLC1v1032151C1 [Oldenlandia corymbosa var. corymbosa]|uniref:OLC1v1032151C1 n=1 Tax=Oldenlandia corymbosa var. corymbosa TaxID=529605 RepID=A0AAV1CL44_OLDCO|nr:OLC1v1032151C1 [Oldenlandia corymbosa var. corymbosa]